jgi:RHS repeat-associated protein
MNTSGAETDRITYSAYGAIASESNPSNAPLPGFTGGIQDRNTAFVMLGVRYENTQTGRFTTEDPSGLGPDINPNRYVGNGPTNGTDPSGLEPNGNPAITPAVGDQEVSAALPPGKAPPVTYLQVLQALQRQILQAEAEAVGKASVENRDLRRLGILDKPDLHAEMNGLPFDNMNLGLNAISVDFSYLRPVPGTKDLHYGAVTVSNNDYSLSLQNLAGLIPQAKRDWKPMLGSDPWFTKGVAKTTVVMVGTQKPDPKSDSFIPMSYYATPGKALAEKKDQVERELDVRGVMAVYEQLGYLPILGTAKQIVDIHERLSKGGSVSPLEWGNLVVSFVGDVTLVAPFLFKGASLAAKGIKALRGVTAAELAAREAGVGAITAGESTLKQLQTIEKVVDEGVEFCKIGCFVAGTPTWVTLPQLAAVAPMQVPALEEAPDCVDATLAIEDVQLGDRVPSRNPTSNERFDSVYRPNYTGCKIIRMEVQHRNGSIVDVQLLRSPEWIRRNGMYTGAVVDLQFTEIEVHAVGRVVSIVDGPEIAPGEGAVVTGCFITRQGSGLVRVTFEDGTELVGTATHPIWSPLHWDWRGLGHFAPGEFVKTRAGVARVVSTEEVADHEPLYNIEVDGEHVYEVTALGILAHNNNPLCDELANLQKLAAEGKLTDPAQIARLAELEATVAPNKAVVIVEQDALDFAAKSKNEMMKLNKLKETANNLAEKGYDVRVLGENPAQPGDIAIKGPGLSGEANAQSKLLEAGTRNAVQKNLVKGSTQAGVGGITVIDGKAAGLTLGEFEAGYNSFLRTSTGRSGTVITILGDGSTVVRTFP